MVLNGTWIGLNYLLENVLQFFFQFKFFKSGWTLFLFVANFRADLGSFVFESVFLQLYLNVFVVGLHVIFHTLT
jgi:hypothetical protein